MKVSIEEISKEQEEEILIRCHEVNEAVYEIVNRIEADDSVLLGYLDNRIHRIKLRDIYYFEAVDGKVYMYGKENVFEIKQKLYELDEQFSDKKFFRASKSTILNMLKISHTYPKLSGRFEAVLDNGERVVISRQYVPMLRSKLGL